MNGFRSVASNRLSARAIWHISTLALGKDVGQIGLKAISEPGAQKLKQVDSAGLYYEGAVFLVELG